MLPDTGWLPGDVDVGGIPLNSPLPTPFIGTYYEGGDGVVIGETELDFEQVSAFFEQSFIDAHFGYGHAGDGSYLRVFYILIVQPQAFGVMLLDSFTPPPLANELFEFDSYTQLACVQGLSGAVVIFGRCKTGTPTEFNSISSVIPSYQEV